MATKAIKYILLLPGFEPRPIKIELSTEKIMLCITVWGYLKFYCFNITSSCWTMCCWTLIAFWTISGSVILIAMKCVDLSPSGTGLNWLGFKTSTGLMEIPTPSSESESDSVELSVFSSSALLSPSLSSVFRPNFAFSNLFFEKIVLIKWRPKV